MPRDTHDPTPGSDPPLLVPIGQLAAALGRSVASLRRDDAAGRLPAPIKLGASKRWVRAEIEAWIRAGCPARAAWTSHPARGDR